MKRMFIKTLIASVALAAAGIPYTVDGPGGIEYRDFHALRHGLLTHGGRAGIDVLTLKEIAGHADAKTTQRYVHLRVHDVAGAMDRIPSILPDETNVIVEKELLKATGTDLVSPEYPPAMAISGHSLASSDNHAMVKGAGHETTKPLLSQGFRHVLAIAGSDGQGEDDGTRTRNLRRDRPPIASPQATKGKRLAPDLKSWHPPSIPLDTAETTISVPVDASGTVDTKALADALKALPLTFAERARLAGLLLAVAFGWTSQLGRDFVGFARESVRETKKVVWPTRKEAMQITGVVFGFVVLMAIFLWGVDKLLEVILYGFILGWR